ncbi:hypothetical protein [Leptodesmis sichuanensis]|uniref:hypothetical protein n=1 Tax=Leptodesmis sichuanensis TaxID=2906798 RepID=UPI001F1F6CAD|nr:hypothetical protein [Leptodesmis sichuanensis]UIE36677.1 hypothetical protein KIK02_16770 [Leptodesmis sichuanensis A121]
MLAQRRTVLLRRYRKGRPSTTPHPQSPGRFWDHRSPLAMALTNHCLGAFAITANPQTTASTDNFLGGFGLTDPAEARVQGLAAELANVAVQRLQKLSNAATIAHQSVATALLAQRRTVLLRRYRKGRPPTTPHPQSPGRLRDARSPLAMALTNHCLGAFAITANPQTTALPDKLLGGFGLTDPAEARVQGLAAELANVAVQRLQINLAPLQPELTNPLQQRC